MCRSCYYARIESVIYTKLNDIPGYSFTKAEPANDSTEQIFIRIIPEITVEDRFLRMFTAISAENIFKVCPPHSDDQ